MASFTDIVKEQRSQGAGVFGSLGKATGQRTLERIDPRNYLFNRNGLAAALFPGLKGFQAKTGTTSKLNEASSSSLSSNQANSLASRIEDVAKNTFVLPGMARDMNVMRQNIIKLVRLGGGKPSNKAMSTKQRQEAYESQFGKKSQSPTQIGKKDDVEKKSGNWFSNLIDFLFSAKGLLSLGILAGLGKLLENEKFRATMIEWVGGFFKAIFNGIAVTADFLGTILTDPAVVESIKNMFSHLFDLAKKIAFLPVTEIEILGHKFTVNLLEAVLGSMAVWFGTKGAMTAMGSILMKSIAGGAIGASAGGLISRALITALGVALSPKVLVAAITVGLAYAINDAMKSNKQGKALDSGNFKQFRESIWKAGNYDHEGGTGETAEETQRLNDETVAELKKIAADEKATPYSRGVANRHLEDISSGVLKLPEPKDMKAITTPTQQMGNEPSEELINSIKKLEGFSAKAFWDHKQYSIGYGTKANNKDEVIDEKEADRRLRAVVKETRDKVVKYGEKYNYGLNSSQIDSLTSFAYNLGPGILDKVTNTGKRSIQEIAEAIPKYNKASGEVNKGLEKRRNIELAMFNANPSSGATTTLASASPASGYNVASASTNINDETRNTMRSSGGNNTIVNSPTTNVASGGNQKGRSAPVYDTDMTNTLMGRQYA